MKDTFFKTTIILLIGGALTKILGMIIKIIMTRIIGLEGMSLYMLVFPTFSLFMTISQLGLPTAISKLVAEEKYNNKKLILSIIPISIIINTILISIILLFAPFISNLLNNKDAILPIISISIVLPFDSLSAILRGYFFGKQKMFPHILSLIIEQCVRLILILLIIPILLKKNIIVAVSGLILVNVISELTSCIVLILFLPNKNIKIKDFKPNKKNINNIFEIAIPNTTSRIIGALSYFLEPIIITTFLLLSNTPKEYILKEYGIIEGYVLPLLLITSFFSNAFNSALIPEISKAYVKKEKKYIKKRTIKTLKITLLIGFITIIFLNINPQFFLKKIYHIEYGMQYIRVLSPFFLILYLQSTFEAVLLSINKSKSIMINNLYGTITKLLCIIILSFMKIGLYNLIIGIILNIIIVTFLDYKIIKKEIL